ncbi:MAG: hypothetical protein U0703_11240 [Anaerolineae bacterium]
MTDQPSIPAQVVEIIIKHLPPSASTLHLLDVTGRVGDSIARQRADVDVLVGVVAFENSVDAVVLYDAALDPDLLGFALLALRPGGRLIVVEPRGEPERRARPAAGRRGLHPDSGRGDAAGRRAAARRKAARHRRYAGADSERRRARHGRGIQRALRPSARAPDAEQARLGAPARRSGRMARAGAGG